MKQVALIKICLNETYRTVGIAKNIWQVSPSDWLEARRLIIIFAFQLCFTVRHNECPGLPTIMEFI
jgi:hypothetical protein